MIPFFVDKYLILYNLISPLKKEAAYYLKMERLATNVVEDIVFIFIRYKGNCFAISRENISEHSQLQGGQNWPHGFDGFNK